MSAPSSLTAPPTKRRYKVAFAVAFAFFVAYFDRTNVTVLITDHEFNSTLGIQGDTLRQGLLLTAFLFPYGLCNFITGPLGDRIGGRNGIIGSIIVWTVLLCVMGFTSSYVIIFAMRLILGVGESIMTPACNMLIAEWFPDRERARANSAWLGGLFLAPAVSFPVIVWIVNSFGWRASFFVLAAVGVFVALPVMLVWTADRPEKVAAVSTAELNHIRNGQVRVVESTADIRKKLRQMFVNYRFWICSFCYMGYGLGFWGIQTFVPSYLQHSRGLDFTASGAFAVAPWLAAFVLTIVGGMIGDRRRKWRVLLWSVGYLVGAGLSVWGVSVGSTGVSIALISIAIGFLGFTLAPMWSAIQEIVPSGLTGTGTGIINGFSFVASAFGPVVVGAIVDGTGSYDIGFIILAGFLVLTALVLAPLWKGHLPRRGASSNTQDTTGQAAAS